MKKKLPVLLMGLGFMALAGCSGGGNNNSQSSDEGSKDPSKKENITPWWTTTGELEKDAEGNVVYDELTIKLATVVAGDDVAAFNDIISKFNQTYRGKINITVENIGQDTFENTISQRVSQNQDAPDLIMSHQKGHKTFEKNHIIQPLDEIIEATGSDYSSLDVVNNLGDTASLGHNGWTFNAPIDAQSLVVFYNKTLLTKYGGTLPTNRSELVELCKKAKAGEGRGFVPLSVASTNNSFFQWYVCRTALAQNGFKFFNENNYTVNWASDSANLAAFTKGVKSINSMFYGDDSFSSYNVGINGALSSFTTGKALFYVAEPWTADSIFAQFGTDNGGKTVAEVKETYVGGYSLAKMFTENPDDANAYKIFGDSHAFAISNTVKDINKKAACLEIINYFTKQAEVGVDWAKAGHISASHLIRNSDTYKSDEYVANYTEKFYTDLNEFVCAGNTPYYSTTFTELDNIFTNCISSKITDDQIKSKLQSGEDNVNLLISL